MKNDLRKKFLKIRKEILEKEFKDNEIYLKIINDSEILKYDTLLIYVSKVDEVNTLKLIEYFLKIKKVAVPKIVDNKMEFYYIDSLQDLELGYSNILEPLTKNKVINFNNVLSITPGICFSKDGYRVGYGKGFYDRFYQEHDVYKVGLCYKECLVDFISVDKYDIPVDKIITD